MAGFSDGQIRDLLAHFGIADDPVAALGISGINGTNRIGVYDDRFYHCVNGKVHVCPGNVDPSGLARGRATLLPMRVFHWKAGIHGRSRPAPRRYPAFVQAEQVTVMRHQQGADTGMFGINHHKGGRQNTSSLGCQTYPADCWNEARARLYAGIGANLNDVAADKKSGRAFPYVVVPFAKANAILKGEAGNAKPTTTAAPAPKTASPWTIRLRTAGQPDEVYGEAVNIAGRVYVPVRDFCAAALDCKPEHSPLEWKEGEEEDDDVLLVNKKAVEEVSEIDGRAFVWIVEVADALGYNLTRNDAAKNLILTPK
jgi:hypothetical protein